MLESVFISEYLYALKSNYETAYIYLVLLRTKSTILYKFYAGHIFRLST